MSKYVLMFRNFVFYWTSVIQVFSAAMLVSSTAVNLVIQNLFNQENDDSSEATIDEDVIKAVKLLLTWTMILLRTSVT